jgi:hypothetical protein
MTVPALSTPPAPGQAQLPVLGPPGAPGPGDDTAVRRRRLLGVAVRADLVSDADVSRDLALRRSAGGVDLAIIEGVDALCQTMAVGLTTLRGSDPFNTGFGFLGLTPLVQQTSPELAREGLRGAVAEFVAGEPRVRRIIDLVTGPPSQGPGSRRLDVTISFETISGDSVTVAVGGLASGQPWGQVDIPGVTV